MITTRGKKIFLANCLRARFVITPPLTMTLVVFPIHRNVLLHSILHLSVVASFSIIYDIVRMQRFDCKNYKSSSGNNERNVPSAVYNERNAPSAVYNERNVPSAVYNVFTTNSTRGVSLIIARRRLVFFAVETLHLYNVLYIT